MEILLYNINIFSTIKILSVKSDTQTHCVRDNGEWWGVWQTEGQKPYRRGTGITQLLVTGVL